MGRNGRRRSLATKKHESINHKGTKAQKHITVKSAGLRSSFRTPTAARLKTHVAPPRVLQPQPVWTVHVYFKNHFVLCAFLWLMLFLPLCGRLQQNPERVAQATEG